ncbi:zinc finger C3HC-type protein 1 [Takifugu rubripes]|uniref:Zinc finger, C3HC-type containing 1 n=1 Tax=Takifugu rubripes TaxID=31033 RepID=A0A3B5KFE6_TAKRU|nr:nuclear-interacting partner of ALK [Takifugu rubripes]|eukprot:XP_003972923.1 PREDICTED: nuclear-interacting partner of ALK [Takifugu rubripes]
MATLGGSVDDSLGALHQHMASLVSPEKVRDLLNDGILSPDVDSKRAQTDSSAVEVKGDTQAPCEATNKEGFFSRVESYSCAKWAAKPRVLSPLMCARYGWINVGCDMLKCSSCQAFLCASLTPALDFEKYESRIAEISKQLQTQHEKFCPWPDLPCPERFWLIPSSEPSVLLTAFLARFKSTCLLGQQLPALKSDQLKSMSLTEDVVSLLLQLIDEEQKKKGETSCTEPLTVQVAACIVALCGWAASPSLQTMNLPILTCSYCMRKVGLWNFYQMEGTGDGDESAPASGPVSSATPEVQDDEAASTSSAPATTPRRMKLRSQDTTHPNQGNGTPSLVALRARSGDTPIPCEELSSPLTRGKRIARNRGQGENPGADSSGTLPPLPKRLCLSLVGGPDEVLDKKEFNPLDQHRDWCPWISIGKENMDPETVSCFSGVVSYHQQGWKAVLDLLIPIKNSNSVEDEPPQGLCDKSERVFAIFRQWQVSSSSQ